MVDLSRRDLIAFLGASAAIAAMSTGTIPAEAKRKKTTTTISWTTVDLPEDPLRTRRERVLRKVLRKESAAEEWGEHKGGKLEASVKVLEFQVHQKEDVVRVTCTAMGKIAQGPSVRTHFSIGDHPQKQAKLEQLVLTLVARGLVTRLAAIARKRAVKNPTPPTP